MTFDRAGISQAVIAKGGIAARCKSMWHDHLSVTNLFMQPGASFNLEGVKEKVKQAMANRTGQ